MFGHRQPTLDCQTCGDPVRELTEAGTQQVAHNPYAFVVYCGPCGRDAERIVAAGGLLP
ncbi:hypothetical protein [Nocardioides pakistanensis]